MNRERAETHLRLVAEAELRDCLTRPPRLAFPGAPLVTAPAKLARAAWALTAVGALDSATVEGILADVELALIARRQLGPYGPGRMSPVSAAWVSGQMVPAVHRIGPLRHQGPNPLARLSRLEAGVAATGPRQVPAATEPRAGTRGAADRYVPVGLMILFHDQTISGELDLMSYVHTAAGARLVATWQVRDPLGSGRRGLPPVDQIAVADDRGARYKLGFSTRFGPESSCELSLHPDPPQDVRWLDITAPGEAAVRVNLERQDPLRARPEVSKIDLSPGEHLLSLIAERLLTMAAEFPQDLRLRLVPVSPGPVSDLATDLGHTVAALEAAEVLSPLSPVPGRLATLCASLRVVGHGITAAPAVSLPEPWLSLLAHYHRRKPDTAPPRDGFAAMTAALPEVDDIGLVLLGLHNSGGETWMNALAFGPLPGDQHGPPALEDSFPLSVWIRDSGGRWHAARPAGWHDHGGEYMLTLQLIPALSRSTVWIEVLATGQSAEVRATVPLRWGYPP
jgi:hypothetical protein